ncbi:MAG: nicotinate-nucleotide adenylyltransferase [Candidatus Saccharicenans sp.]
MSLVGLFGGTFNPVHLGHMSVADQVLRYFPLEKILFIPSYIPPHKNATGVAPVEHRLRMLEIACEGRPAFEISDIEARTPGPSYSVVTLEKLKKARPQDEFFFIAGADAFIEIETWKDYRRLLQECSFIVVTRPGFGIKSIERVVERITPGKYFVAGENAPVKTAELTAGGVFVLEVETPDISSTIIRERIKAGQSISGLVPPAVEKYIEENKLYR